VAKLKAPFDFKEALLCSRLAQWAYLEPGSEEFQANLKSQRLAGAGSLSEKTGEGSIFGKLKVDTQAFAADTDATRYIVFRGSQTGFWDWVTDFRIDTEPRQNHQIHRGFLQAISSSKTAKAVSDWFEGAGGKRVVFAGHSLGGALAALAAILHEKPAAACYTYGQPRIGLIAGNPQTPICRFINRADIVPRVPADFRKLVKDSADTALLQAAALKLVDALGDFTVADVEYKHIGDSYVIGSDGKLAENGEAEYLKFLLRSLPASFASLLASKLSNGAVAYEGDLISDHFGKRYVAALEKLA
jgi:dienelactone hydrolase